MSGGNKRDLILGVDFGTSYSSAALWSGDQVHVVLDNGEPAIPSVLYLPRSGPPIIGADAIRYLAIDPAGTVQSIKRIVGCSIDDRAVRRFSASAGYRLKRGPDNSIVLGIRNVDYACEQIVSMILARLRDLAEQRFGGQVGRIVATVPTTATEEYVASLRKAAALAHMDVVGVLPEPVAGALSLGLHCEPATRRVLVCDFGGGTFDTTAVEQEGSAFNAIACKGDGHLGGDDFDDAMANAIAGVIFKRAAFDMLGDAVRRQGLLRRCESAKRSLSYKPEVRLTMRDAYVQERTPRHIDAIIERSWIEPRWMTLINRSSEVIERLLEAVGWAKSDVDQAVLIGGGALMPLFQTSVQALLPAVPIVCDKNANVAVVLGAALQSAAYAQRAA